MSTMYHEEVKIVVKNGFINLESNAEDRYPALQRSKSDPLLAFVAFNQSAVLGRSASKSTMQPSTTCPSVNGEDDYQSSLPSPDEEASADQHSFSWSFNSSSDAAQVQGFDLPQGPPNGPPMLSTFPAMSPGNDTGHRFSHNGGEWLQSGGYSIEVDNANTTLMVRNLASDLTQAALVEEFVALGFQGSFDFVYMPINFRAQGNFGYAFVNFTSHAAASQAMQQIECLGWNGMWSTCQGLSGNVDRYRNSPLMHEQVSSDCKPALYDCNSNRVPFPAPTKHITKPRIHWTGAKEAAKLANKVPDHGAIGDSSGRNRPGRFQKHHQQQRAR